MMMTMMMMTTTMHFHFDLVKFGQENRVCTVIFTYCGITIIIIIIMMSSLYVCLLVSLSLSNITGKRVNRFTWNLQNRSDLVQEMIWNIYGMFRFTPCIQDYDLCSFWGAHVREQHYEKTRQWIFFEIFRTGQIWDREYSVIFLWCCVLIFGSRIELYIS